MYSKINIEIAPSDASKIIQTAKISYSDHNNQTTTKNIDIYDLVSFFQSLDQDTSIDTGFMSSKLIRKVQKGSVTTKFYYTPFLTTSFKLSPKDPSTFNKGKFLFLVNALKVLNYEFSIKCKFDNSKYFDADNEFNQDSDLDSLDFRQVTIRSLVIHNFTFRNCGLILSYSQKILSYRVVFYENSSPMMFNVVFDKDTKVITKLLPNHFDAYICWGDIYSPHSFEKEFKDVCKGNDDQAWKIVSTYLQSPFNEDLMASRSFNSDYTDLVVQFYDRLKIATLVSSEFQYKDIFDRLLYVWIPAMNSPEVYMELPNIYPANPLTLYIPNTNNTGGGLNEI